MLYTFVIRKSGIHKTFIFNIFLVTFLVNFLANNSIESQLGQNPFVFFTLFYIYFYPQTQKEVPDVVRGVWPPGRRLASLPEGHIPDAGPGSPKIVKR
jgi:hypothetical protein